jgi:hypothetical protein
MRFILFGLLPVAALAACQTADQTTASYQPTLKNYYACVLVHADGYALRSNEDPYHLALAARNACGREQLAAQRAILAAERPAVGPKVWRSSERELIESMTARITRKRVG